jgi:glutathione S-transferase
MTNTDVPDALAQEVSEVLIRGIRAMNSLCRFAPYALGSDISLADIYLRYVLKVVALAGAKLDRDFAAEIDGLAEWTAMMAATDIAQGIDADEKANAPMFFAHLKKRYGI